MLSFFLPLKSSHTLMCLRACAHVSFLLCRVYKKPDLPAVSHRGTLPLCAPSPPEWPTHPVTTRGRRVGGGGGGGMTGDNGGRRKSVRRVGVVGGGGGRIVEAWWVGGGSEASSNVPSPLPCL